MSCRSSGEPPSPGAPSRRTGPPDPSVPPPPQAVGPSASSRTSSIPSQAPLERPPRVLLLDLDRTLVDVESFVDYCAALVHLRRIFPNETAASVDRAWGTCTRTAMAILAARSADPGWPTASAAVERFELAGIERSRPMAGLHEFIARIDVDRVAIVTLLTERGAAQALAQHGIPRPAVVIGRRADLRPKPAPDPVVAALRALGAVAADAVMVGDSEVDEAAARAAGVRFVGLTNGRPEHGFAPGSFVARDLLEAAAVLATLGVTRGDS